MNVQHHNIPRFCNSATTVCTIDAISALEATSLPTGRLPAISRGVSSEVKGARLANVGDTHAS